MSTTVGPDQSLGDFLNVWKSSFGFQSFEYIPGSRKVDTFFRNLELYNSRQKNVLVCGWSSLYLEVKRIK